MAAQNKLNGVPEESKVHLYAMIVLSLIIVALLYMYQYSQREITRLQNNSLRNIEYSAPVEIDKNDPVIALTKVYGNKHQSYLNAVAQLGETVPPQLNGQQVYYIMAEDIALDSLYDGTAILARLYVLGNF